MASFPIGALEERITVPTGSSCNEQLSIPAFVIFFTESKITPESCSSSAGESQRYSPFQYPATDVLGVEPPTTVPTSLTAFHSFFVQLNHNPQTSR